MSLAPVSLVLGAAGGLGEACAERLVSDGHEVVLAGRRREPMETLKARLDGAAGRPATHIVEVDLGSEVSGERLLAEVLSSAGRLDNVLNTVGVYEPRAATELTLEHWDAVINPNLRGALLVTAACAAELARQGRGRIVHLTSITAGVSRGGYAAYEASKAGLAAAARSTAVELAPHGVSVNCVAPGWFRTPMAAPFIDSRSSETITDLIPAGRVGRPEEIAEVVSWLLGPAPDFLTGQTITVDGGQTAHTATL
ncbi:SDR family NAD(P)-dependent oxidoreductase [Actinomycetota bacterium]